VYTELVIKKVKHKMKYVYLTIAFIGGWALGIYLHPYEKCERMYVGPENIAECVWLLENQPALR